MSRNVVIIGQSGAGKSSLINMLCPTANALTSNDATGCTQREQAYECDIGEPQSCLLHDTVGLEEGQWGFLPDKRAQKRLKGYVKTKSPHLLVYCVPGTRGLQKSQARNFNKFKTLARKSNIQIVVVVTQLDNFARRPLEKWWSENAGTLDKLGIPADTKHACVVTLPKHELERSKRDLYDQSREAVKALIRNNPPRTRR